MGHAQMENRNGLVVDACLTRADGHAERVAALAMIEPRADRPRQITFCHLAHGFNPNVGMNMRYVKVIKWFVLSVWSLCVLGSPAFALDIAGKFYTPYHEISATDFRPESLLTMNADGTYEIRTVHFGKQEIYQGTYSVDRQ